MNQVQFGTILSYDDLEMFLSNVNIEPPTAKRTLVDVPGRSGELDLTYGISDDICYQNRKIIMEFVMKDYEFKWQTLFSYIMNRLHGRRFNVYLEPDTYWYWIAFCTVNQAKCDKNKGLVTIELDCDPFMYRDHQISVTATALGVQVTIPITRKTVVPTITSSANIVITKDSVDYSFDAGTHKNEFLRLTEGINFLTVKGSGSVVISYKDGSL